MYVCLFLSLSLSLSVAVTLTLSVCLSVCLSLSLSLFLFPYFTTVFKLFQRLALFTCSYLKCLCVYVRVCVYALACVFANVCMCVCVCVCVCVQSWWHWSETDPWTDEDSEIHTWCREWTSGENLCICWYVFPIMPTSLAKCVCVCLCVCARPCANVQLLCKWMCLFIVVLLYVCIKVSYVYVVYLSFQAFASCGLYTGAFLC